MKGTGKMGYLSDDLEHLKSDLVHIQKDIHGLKEKIDSRQLSIAPLEELLSVGERHDADTIE